VNNLSPIVLVYLNSYLPKYAIRNLQYLERTFPDREIFVLVNGERFSNRRYKLNRTQFVHPNGIGEEITEIQSITSHPQDFRHDFWNATIARFFALEKFMAEKSLQSVFHLEADVLLAPYFSFSELEALDKCIAFPRVSTSAAAASIFFVNDLEVLRKMNSYFKISLQGDPNSTDMRLLSNFADAYADLYFPLFSGINVLSAHDTRKIFDAATFGIYLTGGDPRNRRGWVEFFRNVEDHEAIPSKYVYSFNANKILIAQIGNEEFELQNLHIHSKNIKYFEKSWPSSKLISQIKRSSLGPHFEFSVSAFFSLTYGFISRRFRRILSHHLNLFRLIQ